MWWRVLVLSVLLFVAAFGAHEVLHLLLICPDLFQVPARS